MYPHLSLISAVLKWNLVLKWRLFSFCKQTMVVITKVEPEDSARLWETACFWVKPGSVDRLLPRGLQSPGPAPASCTATPPSQKHVRQCICCTRLHLNTLLQSSQSKERRYNHTHKFTRCVIERTFGILKSLFRYLHKSGGALQYSPETCCKTVATCAMLHNIATRKGIPVELTDTDSSEDKGPGPRCRPAGGVGAAAGRQRLDEITQNYF